MKRSAVKMYRFRLQGFPWMTFIGPVRNKIEATQALYSQFGNLLSEVRLHSPCARTRLNPQQRDHANAA